MKKIILFLLTLSFAHLLHAEKQVATYICPHSPSVNAARELAGWEHQINMPTDNGIYTSISFTPEVTQSFRRERVAQCLFGDDILECKNTFTVAGSRINKRQENYWLADYFGLPTDFVSTVRVKPNASNALLDVNFFLGLDRLLRGLFFRIHAPIVYTRWDLDLSECVKETGTNAHEPGYFNADGIARDQLLDCFTTFASGKGTPQAQGLTFNPLCVAKMSTKSLHKTNLAEIQAALGWNWIRDWYHVGFNIRVAIPAGNRPEGTFLFEPIIGNGHHWEAGGGISTHVTVWEKPETNEMLQIYCDVNVTHMFETKQKRFFDLKEKPNSRYMLATKFGAPIEEKLQGNGVSPVAQFQQEVTPVANLTLFDVKVSNSIQVDLALMMAYTHNDWRFLFGYGFWGRSCDTLEVCCDNRFEKTVWGIKGDTQMFGFEESAGNPAVALSATQSKATVHRGRNFPILATLTAADITTGKQNPRIDNPRPAFADSNNDTMFDQLKTTPGGADQINTSIQPIFLDNNTIDFINSRTKGIAHKIFSHLSHTWYEKRTFTPYLGIGGEVEFSQNRGIVPPNEQTDCINCSFSFWGLWAKGGVSFG